jgi:hypothetical protein
LEADRVEALRLEQERQEFERERERMERERIEAERVERARLEAARIERERQEAAKAAHERIELLKREMERKDAEKKEAERREALEKQEEARVEMINKWRQIELEAEKLESQSMNRKASLRVVAQASQADEERARKERLTAESERAAQEQAEKERERERVEREKLERVRVEAAAAEAKEEEKRQAVQKWKQMEADRAARLQQRKNKRAEPIAESAPPDSRQPSATAVQSASLSDSASTPKPEPFAPSLGRRAPTGASSRVHEHGARVARKPKEEATVKSSHARKPLNSSGTDAQVLDASASIQESSKPLSLSASSSPRVEDKIRAKKLPPIPVRTLHGAESAASKTSNNTNEEAMSDAEKQRVLVCCCCLFVCLFVLWPVLLFCCFVVCFVVFGWNQLPFSPLVGPQSRQAREGKGACSQARGG